jgi:hypothetical protein
MQNRSFASALRSSMQLQEQETPRQRGIPPAAGRQWILRAISAD